MENKKILVESPPVKSDITNRCVCSDPGTDAKPLSLTRLSNKGWPKRIFSFHLFWLLDMSRLIKTFSLLGIGLVAMLWSSFTLAEEETLTLSQDQDGGNAGHACIYIHKGKAEYRIVQSHESCPPTLVVKTDTPPT